MPTPAKTGAKPAKTAEKPKAAAAAPKKTAAKTAAPKAAAAKTAKPAAKPKAAPKAAAKPRTAAKSMPQISPEQRRYYVEVAAYYMAERRGFQGGNPADDWLQAEAEIDRLLREGVLKP